MQRTWRASDCPFPGGGLGELGVLGLLGVLGGVRRAAGDDDA